MFGMLGFGPGQDHKWTEALLSAVGDHHLGLLAPEDGVNAAQ